MERRLEARVTQSSKEMIRRTASSLEGRARWGEALGLEPEDPGPDLQGLPG